MERVERINAELKKQISAIIAEEIKDPRVNGLISIVKVDTAKDLGVCKVYISVMGGNPKETIKVLSNAAGFVRNCLKSKIDLRTIPTIKFIEDNSISYGIKISEILKDIE